MRWEVMNMVGELITVFMSTTDVCLGAGAVSSQKRAHPPTEKT